MSFVDFPQFFISMNLLVCLRALHTSQAHTHAHKHMANIRIGIFAAECGL